MTQRYFNKIHTDFIKRRRDWGGKQYVEEALYVMNPPREIYLIPPRRRLLC